MGLKSGTLFSRPPNGVQGRSPWRAFGDFRRETKVTRGGGAERPLVGSAEGQRPSHIVGRRGPRPCKKAPGGPQSPLYLYPETNKKLHPNVQPARKKSPLRGEKSALRSSWSANWARHHGAQKGEGIFPRFFAAYSKFSGAFDIPSHSRAPCCGCAWRSRLRRFPAG